MAFLPFISVSAISSSAHPSLKPKLASRTNLPTRAESVLGFSVVKPTNSTFCPAYDLRTRSYSGTSLRHGPHQDAHMLITRTLLWKSSKRKLPLSSALISLSRKLKGRNVNGPDKFTAGLGWMSGNGFAGG